MTVVTEKFAIFLKDTGKFHNGGNTNWEYDLTDARLFDSKGPANSCISNSKKNIRYERWRGVDKIEEQIQRLSPPNMEIRSIRITLEMM